MSYAEQFSLEGKTAFVTGASYGLGVGVAQRSRKLAQTSYWRPAASTSCTRWPDNSTGWA